MRSLFLNRRQPTPSDSEGRASAFADHLREHAPDYFPENGGCSPDVHFEWKEVRRGSTLYGFHMAMGPKERRILIRVLSDEVEDPRGIWFTITESTILEVQDGGGQVTPIDIFDIEISMVVQAWHSGVINGSDPVQTEAARITVLDAGESP